MAPLIDHLLLQVSTATRQDPGLLRLAQALAEQSPAPVGLQRVAWSDESGRGYAYLKLATPTTLHADQSAVLQESLHRTAAAQTTVQVSRLQRVFDAPGHSHGRVPSHHYVVEMDPEEGWMPELTRWYDTEHMPGLASVPGTVHAMRLLNHDHGPLSLACYDLDGIGTFESPPWMAVRGTPWSSQMRPHFRNTTRTMFRVLA
jgi:hypothetical protein